MKLTMLGTGVRTPYVLHGLVERQDDLGLSEVVLHDVDGDRLGVMAALGAHLCRTWGASFTVRGEPDARAALEGSRFVFTAIRVGQDEARALDEQIPLRHGVLGQETTGPGGLAMALRTIPVMLEYARVVQDVCPDALVVNFTNPVGIILQALSDHTSVRAVGVCDGPIDMKRSVAAFLGVPGDEVYVDYLGLNHCGWIHRVLVRGEERLPELLERYEELQRGHDSWKLFDPDLVRGLGMLPMEYLYFYYSREQAVQHILSSGGTRGEQVAELGASLWPALRERIDAGDLEGAYQAWERALEARGESYFARERGEQVAAAPAEVGDDLAMFEGEGYEGLATAVMASSVKRQSVSLILNVPNRGAIADLPEGDVVEVTCLCDENGVHPIAQGSMPEAASSLILPVKEYERLTVMAAVEGSREKAVEALAVHPLVGSLPLARSIVDDYLAAHAEFLDYLS